MVNVPHARPWRNNVHLLDSCRQMKFKDHMIRPSYAVTCEWMLKCESNMEKLMWEFPECEKVASKLWAFGPIWVWSLWQLLIIIIIMLLNHPNLVRRVCCSCLMICFQAIKYFFFFFFFFFLMFAQCRVSLGRDCYITCNYGSWKWKALFF